MSEYKQQIEEATASVRAQTDAKPSIGIILGTGLGKLGDGIDVKQTIGYETIRHFPRSTVETHAGRFLFGELGGKSVVAMQGRFHFYEGYSMQQITLPVRVMHNLGIKTLIVSNACGFRRSGALRVKRDTNVMTLSQRRAPDIRRGGVWGMSGARRRNGLAIASGCDAPCS
jgi:hypothetical protein